MDSLLTKFEDRAARVHLGVFGGFHPADGERGLAGAGTVLLLGPEEPGFWPAVCAEPEFQDHRRDPLDRWSHRVVTALAETFRGRALFPFGGPPYQPFIAWAQRSGRAWASPVRLLVHDRAGLMVSYRGAVALPERIELPPAPPCPCDVCAGKPCLSACPVTALDSSGYDLAACHAYLETGAGRDCMTRGCAVRRACPVSRQYGRGSEQSAYHMKAFHP